MAWSGPAREVGLPTLQSPGTGPEPATLLDGYDSESYLRNGLSGSRACSASPNVVNQAAGR